MIFENWAKNSSFKHIQLSFILLCECPGLRGACQTGLTNVLKRRIYVFLDNSCDLKWFNKPKYDLFATVSLLLISWEMLLSVVTRKPRYQYIKLFTVSNSQFSICVNINSKRDGWWHVFSFKFINYQSSLFTCFFFYRSQGSPYNDYIISICQNLRCPVEYRTPSLYIPFSDNSF